MRMRVLVQRYVLPLYTEKMNFLIIKVLHSITELPMFLKKGIKEYDLNVMRTEKSVMVQKRISVEIVTRERHCSIRGD